MGNSIGTKNVSAAFKERARSRSAFFGPLRFEAPYPQGHILTMEFVCVSQNSSLVQKAKNNTTGWSSMQWTHILFSVALMSHSMTFALKLPRPLSVLLSFYLFPATVWKALDEKSCPSLWELSLNLPRIATFVVYFFHQKQHMDIFWYVFPTVQLAKYHPFWYFLPCGVSVII